MQKIISEWFPLGIVCNEIGGARADQPQERLLNVCIRGRTSVTNLWGQHAIRDGTRLWVVLYWSPTEGGAATDDGPTFRTRLNEETDDHIRLDGGQPGCWQFGCWADRLILHPTHGDATREHSFQKQYGIEAGDPLMWPICVGRVSSKGYLHSFGSDVQTKKAHTDVDQYTVLPQFEMFVDPDLELPWVASTK
jgi:hypothetical protein